MRLAGLLHSGSVGRKPAWNPLNTSEPSLFPSGASQAEQSSSTSTAAAVEPKAGRTPTHVFRRIGRSSAQFVEHLANLRASAGVRGRPPATAEFPANLSAPLKSRCTSLGDDPRPAIRLTMQKNGTSRNSRPPQVADAQLRRRQRTACEPGAASAAGRWRRRPAAAATAACEWPALPGGSPALVSSVTPLMNAPTCFQPRPRHGGSSPAGGSELGVALMQRPGGLEHGRQIQLDPSCRRLPGSSAIALAAVADSSGFCRVTQPSRNSGKSGVVARPCFAAHAAERHRAPSGQRMPDEPRFDPVTAVELALKGKDHQHLAHVAPDQLDPSLVPRPELWAYVINHRNAAPVQLPRQAEIELRESRSARRHRAAAVNLVQQAAKLR